MIDAFYYLDKRNKDGLLLKFTAFKLSYKLSEFALKKIKKTKTYDQIINFFPEKYIELFFMKNFTAEFLQISSKIMINNWNLENNVSDVNRKIFLDKYYFELLQDFKSSNNLNIYRENILISFFKFIILFLKLIKHEYIIYYYHYLINFFNQEDTFSQINKNIIAVNYVEGIQTDRKSDLSWFDKSNISNSEILIYFESQLAMNLYNTVNYNALKHITQKGYKYVKIWKFKNKVIFTSLHDCKKKINNKIVNDLIETYVRKTFLQFSKKIDFWYSFFSFYNVKLHFDPIENGISTIAKQIALSHLKGCSIGKVRSYIGKNTYNFVGFYPNNIFFTWGPDGTKKIGDTYNTFDQVIISGYPEILNSKKRRDETDKIKNQFSNNGVKFTILLLDSNHDQNKNSIRQHLDTNYLYNFYLKFLEWLEVDQEVGIIIKSKKPQVLGSLKTLKPLLDKSIETQRCCIVKDSFGGGPAYYSSICDFSIAVSSWLSSAVIECALHNCKSLYLDYPNLRNLEKDIFKDGEDKIVFSDINNMLLKLKDYKKNPSNLQSLGDWSKIIDQIDPYRDGKGSERIGKYVKFLHEGYKKGMVYESILSNANLQYSQLITDQKI